MSPCTSCNTFVSAFIIYNFNNLGLAKKESRKDIKKASSDKSEEANNIFFQNFDLSCLSSLAGWMWHLLSTERVAKVSSGQFPPPFLIRKNTLKNFL